MKLKKLLNGLAAGLGLSLGIAGTALADDAARALNFGIISTESSQNLKTLWQPFLADMSRELGVEVKPFFASDYAGIIQGMRFDKVDVAWFGNKSAMEAVDRAGGEIFAQTIDVTGNPGYWSVLITQASNDRINNIDDMFQHAGELNFGNGDPNSTSGFLVPGYYVFARNGVDPKVAFKRTTNAGHETNFLSVANGQLDIATNNTENVDRIAKTHPDKVEKVKVIWTSPLIPSDPIVWRKNLPEADKSKIYDFIMGYGTDGDAQHLTVLKALGWAPFKPSSDDQLLPIRQLVLFKERLALVGDTTLNDTQRQAKLAEIDTQLATLNRRMAALDAAAR